MRGPERIAEARPCGMEAMEQASLTPEGAGVALLGADRLKSVDDEGHAGAPLDAGFLMKDAKPAAPVSPPLPS